MIAYSTDVLVSIVIPYYNNENTITETLECIAFQVHKNLEVILVEDLDSNPIRKELLSYLNLNIFFYKNDIKKGASSNRNFGLEKVNGKYVQFLDADDIISKDKISSQIKLLNGNISNISICKWNTFKDNVSECKINDSILYQDWEKREYLAHLNGTFSELMPIHSYLIPINLIRKTKGWDEDISLGDDGEFMNRIILNTNLILFSDKGVAHYRRGDTKSLSHRVDKKSIESNLLCSVCYEELIKTYFNEDKYMLASVIRKYNLLFLWSYNKYPNIALEAETKIKNLGGKLNMRVGSKSSRLLQFIFGLKTFLKLKQTLKVSNLLSFIKT